MASLGEGPVFRKKAPPCKAERISHSNCPNRFPAPGVSFELIQQLLGHRDMDSMKLYLSIDEQGLKQCALPLLSHRKAGG